MYIQAFLKNNKIQTTQFTESDISDLCNLVEDIAGENCSNVALYVDYTNFRISGVLSKEIKMNYENIKVIWFGEAVNECCEDMIRNYNVDICIFEEYEESFLKLTEHYEDNNNTNILTKTLTGNLINEYASPYELKMISMAENEVLKVKIMQGNPQSADKIYCYKLENVIKELSYITSHINNSKNKIIEFISNDFFSYYEYTELINKLKQNNYPFSYEIQANIVSISEKVLINIYEAGIKIIDINCYDVSEISSQIKIIDEIKKAIGKVKNMNLSLNFYVNKNANSKNIIKIVDYILDNKIMTMDKIKITDVSIKECLTISQNSKYGTNISLSINNNLYEVAMKNGLVASITGLYPQRLLNNGTKHINIGNNILRKEDYEKLKEYTNINSAIFKNNNKNLYEEYYKNLNIAQEGNYFLSHYHQLFTKSGKMFIRFDSCTGALKINRVKYSEIKKVEENFQLEDEVRYLVINDDKDLKRFIDDVEYFRNTGKIKWYNVYFDIEDNCRWSNKNLCTLKSLVRFNLDQNLNIRPCNSCKSTIGSIEKSYIDNVRQVYKISDKEHISRECGECDSRDNCSKCVMLPDFLSPKEYCKIIKGTPAINEFNFKRAILKYLKLFSEIFSQIDIEDIKFSTRYKTHLFPNDIDNDGESVVENFVNLLFAKNTPILFETLENRIIKISDEVAFVLEGGLKGISSDIIMEEYENEFNTSEADAFEIINNIENTLYSKGFVKVKNK